MMQSASQSLILYKAEILRLLKISARTIGLFNGYSLLLCLLTEDSPQYIGESLSDMKSQLERYWTEECATRVLYSSADAQSLTRISLWAYRQTMMRHFRISPPSQVSASSHSRHISGSRNLVGYGAGTLRSGDAGREQIDSEWSALLRGDPATTCVDLNTKQAGMRLIKTTATFGGQWYADLIIVAVALCDLPAPAISDYVSRGAGDWRRRWDELVTHRIACPGMNLRAMLDLAVDAYWTRVRECIVLLDDHGNRITL